MTVKIVEEKTDSGKRFFVQVEGEEKPRVSYSGDGFADEALSRARSWAARISKKESIELSPDIDVLSDDPVAMRRRDLAAAGKLMSNEEYAVRSSSETDGKYE